MAYRTKRSVLTLHKKAARDAAKTIEANSPGGRYYKATVSDKIAAAVARVKR